MRKVGLGKAQIWPTSTKIRLSQIAAANDGEPLRRVVDKKTAKVGADRLTMGNRTTCLLNGQSNTT